MKLIGWTDRARDGEVLHRVKDERNIVHGTKIGTLNGLVRSCVGTAF